MWLYQALFKNFIFKKIFIYLSVPGLSCGKQDLGSCLQPVGFFFFF